MGYDFWVEYPDKDIVMGTQSFMHFSTKLSNSNVNGGLAVKQYVDLPYIAVSTITPGVVEMKSGVSAGYQKMIRQMLAVQSSNVAIQFGLFTQEMREWISSTIKVELQEFGELVSEKKALQKKRLEKQSRVKFKRVAVSGEAIERMKALMEVEAHEENRIVLDRRLKQLLVFDEDLQRDVSVTPLRSFGLSDVLEREELRMASQAGNLTVEEHTSLLYKKKAQLDKEIGLLEGMSRKVKLYRHLFRRCSLELGGENPQNIGIHPKSALRRPIVVDLPSVSPEIRQALSVHYKGVPVVDYKKASSFALSWHIYRGRGYSWDKKTKDFLRKQVIHLVSDLNERLQEVEGQLVRYQEYLSEGGSSLWSNKVLTDDVMSGLVDPSLRTKDWAKAYSDRVMRDLIDVKFWIHAENQWGKMLLSEVELLAIKSMVEEEVL